MNELFPIYGVTLGGTKVSDIESNADDVHNSNEGRGAVINEVFFTEVANEGCIRYAGICNSQQERVDIPKKWRNALGLNWEMSIEESKSILKQKGFKIESLTECKDYHSFYDSKLTVISPDDSLIIDLRFSGKIGLQWMMVSMNDCPLCNSKDIEFKTDENSLLNFFVCNECGHRWGLGYLKEE